MARTSRSVSSTVTTVLNGNETKSKRKVRLPQTSKIFDRIVNFNIMQMSPLKPYVGEDNEFCVHCLSSYSFCSSLGSRRTFSLQRMLIIQLMRIDNLCKGYASTALLLGRSYTFGFSVVICITGCEHNARTPFPEQSFSFHF